MFHGRKIESARGAPAHHLDVAMLVCAFRHVVCGQVGDRGQVRVKRGRRAALFLFQRGHCGLEVGDFGLQRLGAVLVALRHRLPDQLGGFVAPVLQVLQPGSERAALFIEHQQRRRERIEPAFGEGSVERRGIFTDQANVMHGGGLCPLHPAIVQPSRYFAQVLSPSNA